MMTRNKAFFINGGAGRVVCSIPALEKFAEENPDNNFIIICGWSESVKRLITSFLAGADGKTGFAVILPQLLKWWVQATNGDGAIV